MITQPGEGAPISEVVNYALWCVGEYDITYSDGVEYDDGDPNTGAMDFPCIVKRRSYVFEGVSIDMESQDLSRTADSIVELNVSTSDGAAITALVRQRLETDYGVTLNAPGDRRVFARAAFARNRIDLGDDGSGNLTYTPRREP